MHPKDAEGIANSVDPALFAQICLSKNLGILWYLVLGRSVGDFSLSHSGLAEFVRKPCTSFGFLSTSSLVSCDLFVIFYPVNCDPHRMVLWVCSLTFLTTEHASHLSQPKLWDQMRRQNHAQLTSFKTLHFDGTNIGFRLDINIEWWPGNFLPCEVHADFVWSWFCRGEGRSITFRLLLYWQLYDLALGVCHGDLAGGVWFTRRQRVDRDGPGFSDFNS